VARQRGAPNFVADNFVADKRNNGSHVHNLAHPSRYCDLKLFGE